MSTHLFHSPKGEEEKHAYHTPLEQRIHQFLTPLQNYIYSQVLASMLLLACTIAAILWASIPSIANTYYQFTNMMIGLHIGDYVIDKSLRFWVNDLLLTIFFFVIGLEIKRELLVGELTNHKKAMLIVFAAVGGMVIPAAIYYLLNINTPEQKGWGIPMATDTAFALGILACLKHRLPKGVFVFMASLAIIDDIGAILVVAMFYTQTIELSPLFIAACIYVVLILINYSGFRNPAPYILIGLLFWFFIEEAGIHGTLAGILVAFVIPSRPNKGPVKLIESLKELIHLFKKRREINPMILQDKIQHEVLEKVQKVAKQATTPLQRWENKLRLPIVLLILPCFALVNAGIPVSVDLISHLFTDRLALGILFGLVVGKPLGVLLFSYLALTYRIGVLPSQTQFSHIVGVACLTGIGFTMSLFITNLGFYGDAQALLISKAAIFVGSLLAAVLGIVYLLMTTRQCVKDK